MKTLHLYVLRQALSTLVMTVCVFALILLLGNILREILALLVNRQASPFLILEAIALLLPWIMAYVLPFALLTAMLLLFGRLSADNELTAMKASGISLLSLIMPLLLLALVMSGLCAWFNLKITPESRVTYKRLLVKLGLQNTDTLITEERIITEIPDLIIYVRKKSGDILEDVRIYNLDKDTREIVTRTSAAKARIKWDLPANNVVFELFDGFTERLRFEEVPVYEPAPALAPSSLSQTNLLGQITNVPTARVIGKTRIRHWDFAQFGSFEEPAKLPNMESSRGKKISEMSFAELKLELARYRQQGISVTPILVYMHRQIAFSFASFGFTLIAIPLGIRAHRRETSIGMAISLLLALVYYSFLILSEALQMRDRLHPHLLVWIPNLLFQLLGATLLYRANRKG
jgi:lipopolysaccharide export system permease protein